MDSIFEDIKISQKIELLSIENCEGCRNNYPSIKSHACMTDSWVDKVFKFGGLALKASNVESKTENHGTSSN